MTGQRKAMLALIALLLVVAALATSTIARGQQVVSENDRELIETTVNRTISLSIESMYTLDSSGYTDVYVNDSRGGPVPDGTLELIQYIRQDKSLTLNEVGYLDYQVSVVAWFKQAIEKREAIFARMEAEGRDQMTEEEAASLVDETGRVAKCDRGPEPSTITPDKQTVQSIEITDDVAKVVVLSMVSTYELTMVKIDERWYIAGSRLLETHY